MPSRDSFIDANNVSAADLAALLARLSSNEAEYSRYMAFKNHPLSPQFQQIALMSYTHPNVLCRLCAYAADRRGQQH
jgi:hypothetical protein